MRKIVILAMVVFLVMGLAGLGLAGTKKIQAKPFIIDIDETGLAAAAWVTHQGLPDAGKSAHALMLQISEADPPEEGEPPADPPALPQVGAVIKGVQGLTLTELGFDIKNDGVFLAGPRFEVITEAGTFPFILPGTQTPVDGFPDWTRVRFDAAALAVIGTAVVQSVRIIFDEEGSILLDNIDVNTVLIGKPGNAKIKIKKPKKEKNVT
jgi:hypothetical protein